MQDELMLYFYTTYVVVYHVLLNSIYLPKHIICVNFGNLLLNNFLSEVRKVYYLLLHYEHFLYFVLIF